MAINITAMKNAMNPVATTVPPGWLYDAMRDGYVNDQGLRINRLAIDTHGGVTKAIIAIHGPQALQGATGASGATGAVGSTTITNGGFVAQSLGDLSISDRTYAFANPPTSVIAIETKVGRISVDIDTGDITVPVGIGRDDAIREFWFGFQKYFQPSNKAKYETQIEGLKRDYERLETYYKEKFVEIEKGAANPIVDKIKKKYGNEKFIMVKPEDLIRFIEESK